MDTPSSGTEVTKHFFSYDSYDDVIWQKAARSTCGTRRKTKKSGACVSC